MGNICGCNNEPLQNNETDVVYYNNIIAYFNVFSLAKIKK